MKKILALVLVILLLSACDPVDINSNGESSPSLLEIESLPDTSEHTQSQSSRSSESTLLHDPDVPEVLPSQSSRSSESALLHDPDVPEVLPSQSSRSSESALLHDPDVPEVLPSQSSESQRNSAVSPSQPDNSVGSSSATESLPEGSYKVTDPNDQNYGWYGFQIKDGQTIYVQTIEEIEEVRDLLNKDHLAEEEIDLGA